jgi:uncharacterized protein
MSVVAVVWLGAAWRFGPAFAGEPVAAVSESPPPPASVSASGEVVPLAFGAFTLQAHVADTPAERNHGLMAVTSLGADEGMVFVYPRARELTFWMKDTPLPLSIAYVGADGRVVHLADMQPFDTQVIPSNGVVLYAVEAHQGWFREHSVAVGAVVGGLPAPASE